MSADFEADAKLIGHELSTESELPARRDFIRLALAALPTGSLLSMVACGADPGFEAESTELRLQTADDGAEQEQRTRWLQLHDAYVGRKNMHDLPGIVDSFSREGTLIINDLPPFVGPLAIADAFKQFGLSSEPGGLSNTQVIPEREHFTSGELLIEGRILGVHVGQLLEYPPSLGNVELHYAAFHRFDADGKLVSERITMNWAPLAGG